MGVLGKDLFDFHRPQTNTKVEFGASAYWVEDRTMPQPYGAVLTEILNLDVAPFQELLNQLNTAVQEKSDNVLRAYMDMKKGLASLPLYRLYLEDFRVFGDMPVEAFAVGEAQDAFAEFVMQEDHDLPAFMQQQIDDIRLIQERYAWFLDGIFAGKSFEKKKGQRKNFSGTTDREKRLGAVRQRRQPWRRFEGGRAEGKRAILHPWHWARGGGGRKNVL